MKTNVFLAIVIIGLGLSYAAMHVNLVVTTTGLEGEHVRYQISLAQGAHPEAADSQSRLIFPHLVKMTFAVFNKYSWALFAAEALCAVFSLFAFFLLSYALIGDKNYALLSTLAMSVFTPYGFQLLGRYGELLILGLYSVLLFFILMEKPVYYIAFLIIASLQRPDVALSSVFFIVIYHLFIARRYRMLILDLMLMPVPVVTALFIKHIYGIKFESYLDVFFTIGLRRFLENAKAVPSLIFMYAPVIILGAALFRSFDRKVKLILLSAAPYLIMVTMFGSYSEPRLLFPLFSVTIIGVVGVFKNRSAG